MLSYVIPAPWEHASKFRKALPRAFRKADGNKPALEATSAPVPAEDQSLYHVVLTTTHLNPSSDPNCQVQTLRICGTFTTPKAAHVWAHRTLFDAGYERDWFVEYETTETEFEQSHVRHRQGLAVYAKAKDGTEFRVTVSVGRDTFNLRPIAGDDSKIRADLYHVVKTTVLYHEDETGSERENTVEGSFTSYSKARAHASKVLLLTEPSSETTTTATAKDSFAEYEEAAENETDCGYGENVVVHAVSEAGENYLVSVVKGQEMESVRLAEAAMRIG